VVGSTSGLSGAVQAAPAVAAAVQEPPVLEGVVGEIATQVVRLVQVALVVSQAAQVAPAVPQTAEVVPVEQTPEEMQPVQAVQTLLTQVLPVVQAAQAAPPVPQAAVLVPASQVRASPEPAVQPAQAVQVPPSLAPAPPATTQVAVLAQVLQAAPAVPQEVFLRASVPVLQVSPSMQPAQAAQALFTQVSPLAHCAFAVQATQEPAFVPLAAQTLEVAVQSAHTAPAVPQPVVAVPVWQTPALSMQPAQATQALAMQVLPAPHWLVAVHWTQAPVVVLQTTLPASAPEVLAVQSTQMAPAVPVPQEVLVMLAGWTQAPPETQPVQAVQVLVAVLQTGLPATLAQSVLDVHSTQVLVAVLQTAVDPLQSVFWVHWTHLPPLQTGVVPEQPTQVAPLTPVPQAVDVWLAVARQLPAVPARPLTSTQPVQAAQVPLTQVLPAPQALQAPPTPQTALVMSAIATQAPAESTQPAHVTQPPLPSHRPSSVAVTVHAFVPAATLTAEHTLLSQLKVWQVVVTPQSVGALQATQVVPPVLQTGVVVPAHAVALPATPGVHWTHWFFVGEPTARSQAGLPVTPTHCRSEMHWTQVPPLQTPVGQGEPSDFARAPHETNAQQMLFVQLASRHGLVGAGQSPAPAHCTQLPALQMDAVGSDAGGQAVAPKPVPQTQLPPLVQKSTFAAVHSSGTASGLQPAWHAFDALQNWPGPHWELLTHSTQVPTALQTGKRGNEVSEQAVAL